MRANLRRRRSELERLYPWVDFSLLRSEEDEVWHFSIDDSRPGHKVQINEKGRKIETKESMFDRIKSFKTFLLAHEIPQNAKRIAVVSHSGYLARMMFNISSNEQRALRHVHPYEYIVESPEQW